MTRILIVKTSSLGDVVHNLPTISDIARAVPDAQIDWIVEDSFSAIPALHKHVARVIPVTLRRWRAGWWRREVRNEVDAFRRELRETAYDAVVDTQGLLKSALVTWSARGRRCGLDWKSSREPLSFLYDETYRVSWDISAVERNRSLAAQALRYTPNGQVAYGIAAPEMEVSWLTRDRYVVLIHATSARSKLWREAHWIELGKQLTSRGLTCVLPWGSPQEHARSVRLSRAIGGSIVPPAWSLTELASIFVRAKYAIGVDTGLTHLAGALGVPTIGIYTATDPAQTGLYGCARAVNVGARRRPPAPDEVLRLIDDVTR